MGTRSEGAALVVGAAVLDARYCTLLLEAREQALRVAARQPCAPAHVRLTLPERAALLAIPARTLQEFAQGVVGEPLLAGGRSLRPAA